MDEQSSTDPKLPPPAMHLADGQPCSTGTRVFATQCSSRGNYVAGDIGRITRINAAGPFVRWDGSGKETQASFKRLQAVPSARGGVPIELADGRPVRPGLRVAMNSTPTAAAAAAAAGGAAAAAAAVNGVEKGAVGTITLVAVDGNQDLVEVLLDDGPGGRTRRIKKTTVDRRALRCVDSRMLRLATFNIGTRCQSLHVAGSEAGTVQRMIDAGAPKWGKGAAEFMASLGVDLLGVQEMHPRGEGNRGEGNASRFAKFMGRNYGYHQMHTSAVLYNRERVGVVDHLPRLRGCKGVRSACAIYVRKLQLVFMSVWLNHDRHKVPMLESLDQDLRKALQWPEASAADPEQSLLGACGSSGRPVHRVVVAMDSNDFSAELNVQTFRLLGRELRHVGIGRRSGKPWPHGELQTCAEDCSFSLIGDYIFDSASTPATQATAMVTRSYRIAPLPPGVTPFTQLLSDHLAVMWDGLFEPPQKEKRQQQRPVLSLKEKARQAARAEAIALKEAAKSPAAMDVIFIRHGQSEANASDTEGPEHYDAELTALGLQQAAEVNAAPSLAGVLHERIDTLLVSPLRRALQTANGVFRDRLPGRIIVVPEAREIYWHMESCRGHVGSKWREFIDNPDKISPEFRARIVNPEVMDAPSEHFHPDDERELVQSSRLLELEKAWNPQDTDGVQEALQLRAVLSLRAFVKQLAELQKSGTAGRHVAVVCHWGVIRNVVGIAPGNCEVVPTKWFPHPDHFEVAQSGTTSNAQSGHAVQAAAAMDAVRSASREGGGRKAGRQLLGAVRAFVRLERGLVLQKRKKANRYNPLGINITETSRKAARDLGVAYAHTHTAGEE